MHVAIVYKMPRNIFYVQYKWSLLEEIIRSAICSSSKSAAIVLVHWFIYKSY